MEGKNLFMGLAIFSILLIATMMPFVTSAKGIDLTILNPVHGETYSEEITSFEFEVDALNPNIFSRITCWYTINNFQEKIIPCQEGLNNYDQLKTIEGTNILDVYIMDTNGNTASDKILFEIEIEEEEEENCSSSGYNYYVEDDELEEFYRQKALDDDLKRRTIHLNDPIDEVTNLTWWQKFVNWIERIFD